MNADRSLQEAWHLLAIFVATVVGFIAKPLPMGAVGIIYLQSGRFVQYSGSAKFGATPS